MAYRSKILASLSGKGAPFPVKLVAATTGKPADILAVGSLGRAIGNMEAFAAGETPHEDGDTIGGLTDFGDIRRGKADNGLGTGYITSVLVKMASVGDRDLPAMDVALFRGEPDNSTVVDNQPIDVSVTDIDTVLSPMSVVQFYRLGTIHVGYFESRIPVDLIKGESLFGALILRNGTSFDFSGVGPFQTVVFVDQN